MNKKRKEQDEGNLLKDRISPELVNKLSSKKLSLKKEAEFQQAEERKRKIEERRRKEANKSFEELLEESDMNWHKYK